MLRKVGYGLNAFSILLLGANLSSAQDAYFNGKTIRILAGFPSGGGVDAEGRMLARFLPPHISGNPTVVVQNMPGAGGTSQATGLNNLPSLTV